MRQKDTNDDSPRDGQLGSALKAASQTLAAVTGSRFPLETDRGKLRAMAEASVAGTETRDGKAEAAGLRGYRRLYVARLGLAASFAVAAGGTIAVAFASSRHAGRSETLAFARTILPDNSTWVGEAVAGDLSPQDGIQDFVESIWKNSDGFDPFGPTL